MSAPIVQPTPVGVPFGDSSTWHSSLDPVELARHVAWCKAPSPTTKEKGARLEQLLCWLIGHIPGFSVEERNLFAADGSQEIDLLAWNAQLSNGFPSMGDKIIAECKNWERPVDSSDVAWFAWKMRLGGVTDGILLAANGVTSKSKRRGAAVDILVRANSDTPSRRIYTLTLDEVAALGSTDELRRLLVRKSLRLTAQDPFS